MTDLGRPGAGSEGASVGGLTASPRSLQTLWPGPRESRRSWPPLCLDPASQRLPRPVGGRGVLRPTSARVRGDEETDFRSGKQSLVYNCCTRKTAAVNGSVSKLDVLHQNLQRLVLCWEGILPARGSECDPAAGEPAELRVVQPNRKRCTFLEPPYCCLAPCKYSHSCIQFEMSLQVLLVTCKSFRVGF